MPASAAAAIAELTPGTTSNGDPRRRQRQRFLAAAAEHERVSSLETHDAAAASRRPHHQPVDELLAHRGPAGTLADEDALRRGRQLERRRIDERVVEHDFRLGETLRRLAGQEIEIAWSGADERDEAAQFGAHAGSTRDAYRRLSASSSSGRRSAIGTRSASQLRRSSCASAIHRSRSSGSSDVERLAQQSGQRRRLAVGR